jgi:ribonuclease HI
MGKKSGPGFYAVARGRKTGIFRTWSECEAQVKKFPNARFKGFKSEEEAKDYIKEHAGNEASTVSANSDNLKLTSEIPQPIGTVIQSDFEKQKSTVSNIPGGKFSKPLEPDAFERMQQKSYEMLKKAGFAVEPPPEEGTEGPRSSGRRGRQAASTALKRKAKDKETKGDETIMNKRAKLSDREENAGVKLEDFTVDPFGYVVVYTDGACSQNGRKGSKAGIGVWFRDDHYLNLSEPLTGRQTNNNAEIQAAEKAILQAKKAGINKLNIKTDSKFVINCITQWLPGWKKKGWILRTGEPVINRVELEMLDEATKDMNIKWTYVPGHQGHVGNEAADRLAVEGASRSQ